MVLGKLRILFKNDRSLSSPSNKTDHLVYFFKFLLIDHFCHSNKQINKISKIMHFIEIKML